MPYMPSLRRPEELAQVPGGLGEVLVGEAPTGLQHADAVALLGQPQRGDAAAETRTDDQDVVVRFHVYQYELTAPVMSQESRQRLDASASDGQADLLEFLEVAVAGLGHRPAQPADQVQRAERVVGRAVEHLLQRRPLADRDLQQRAARQRRVRGGRRPEPAVAQRLGGLRPAACPAPPRRRRRRWPWPARRRCGCRRRRARARSGRRSRRGIRGGPRRRRRSRWPSAR